MATQRANPLRTFHFGVVLYVALLSIAEVTSSGLLKLIANAGAIGIFGLAVINWLYYATSASLPKSWKIGLFLFYFGLAGSATTTFQSSELVDIIKIAIAPTFIIIGSSVYNETDKWSFDVPPAKLLFLILIFLPLVTWLIQLSAGLTEISSTKQVGIFANRNNAGLYAITLLAFYGVLARKTVVIPFVYVGVGVMFGTLGLLLAVILSLFINIGKFWHFLLGILFIALLIILLSLAPELSIILRIKPVLDSIALLASGRIDLETVTYGNLVLLLNTTDLSFLFRLKHWYNLFNIYIYSDWIHWLFGLGAGASVKESTIHLVPHNDYIRVIFEFGLVTFCGFLFILFGITKSIGRGLALTSFLTVIIYFGTENLINNYIAMVLFFFSAGVISQRALSLERKVCV